MVKCWNHFLWSQVKDKGYCKHFYYHSANAIKQEKEIEEDWKWIKDSVSLSEENIPG